MSVTPPETFQHYQRVRNCLRGLEQIPPAGQRQFRQVVEACDLATESEFEVLRAILQITPVDVAMILDWATAVLWEHEPFPLT
jgi:hypothetical protein